MAKDQDTCPHCGTGSKIHPVGKETCARAEWKPIATAPRTGQTILLCDRAFGDRCEPEYWQPLPAHPTDKTILGKLK